MKPSGDKKLRAEQHEIVNFSFVVFKSFTDQKDVTYPRFQSE